VNGMRDRDDEEFTGLLLMVAGALVAGLGGACTWSQIKAHAGASALISGGVPTVFGVMLFVAGLIRFLDSRAG
jgi:hypothetical protein